ncbi:MAG: hypothetical protein H6742_17960 [Alphaproteobacteria bacterium]|nr:hypothetical protein [Alphaproteobacteria bacterium]
MRPVPSSLLAVLLVVGCGRDPILDRAEQLEGARPGAEGAPAGGGGGPAAVGRPGEPPPGAPTDPPPGEARPPAEGSAVAPPPGTPSEPRPGGDSGPKIAVTGRVVLADYHLGTVQIDAFDGDQKALDGPRPGVLGVARIDKPGEFRIEVPVGTEQVWLGAHVDEDLDGRPNPQEPSAWYAGNPVKLGEDGVTDIVLQLERQPPPPQHGL